MEQELLQLGHVVAVSGSRVTAILASGEGTTIPPGAVQVGAMVRVATSGASAYGLISSLRVEDPQSPPRGSEKKFFEFELLGELSDAPTGNGPNVFQRGVSTYPAMGSDVFAATRNDLATVYSPPEAAHVRIGSIQQDRSLGAHVLTDDLLGKHFAVLGTSGAGKSCSVALILRAILDEHPNGHVVLLDPHNEYGQAFGSRAERIEPGSLQLPYWLLNFEETIEVFVGGQSRHRDAEIDILRGAIHDAKKRFVGDDDDNAWVTVDTPVPYRLEAVLRTINDAMGMLDKPENSAPYLRLKSRIDTLSADSRFDFMFSRLFLSDTMPEILSRILRIPVDGRPITIFDLSGVPSEIVDVVVSMLCRMIFDFAVWSDREKSCPVLLVAEEAHRYVPRDASAGFESTRIAVSRIAKEGRKYGVSLCLVTQRPSELSATILSQCNTLFALRMSNQTDQEFVARALPDSALGLLGALPALRTQEAVVVGEGVTVPMRMRFDDVPAAERPRSGTASFSGSWQTDSSHLDFIGETIERWRRQKR